MVCDGPTLSTAPSGCASSEPVSKSRKLRGRCEARGRQGKADVPHLLQQFEQLPGLIELAWKTAGPAKG